MTSRVEISKFFEPSSPEDWAELATATLRGKPLSKLTRSHEDGIKVAPVYHTPSVDLPAFSAQTGGWSPVSVVVGSTNLSVRAEAELARGCDTVWVRGEQIAMGLPESMSVILEPGHLESAEAGGAQVYFDLLSASLQTGAWNDEGWSALIQAQEKGLNVGSFSALEVHDMGATPALELACILATAAATAREFGSNAADPTALFAHTPLVVGVSTRVFEEVAKIRALRWVWQKVMSALGFESNPVVHVVASQRSLASLDTWSNAIRATTQVVAGALGGASRVSIYPHDARLQQTSDAGERLATTAQHVLAKEAHLQTVNDPAAGSWFIDELTDALARKAWAEFQAIEASGGIKSFLVKGEFAKRVQSSVDAREADYAKRKRTRVGVNEFANADEPSALGSVQPKWPKATGDRFERPAPYFEGQAWEELHRSNRKKGPVVFLANLGPIPRHKARADYITRLFEAAGFTVVSNLGFGDLESAVAGWNAAGAQGFVLCGHDDDYAGLGRDVANGIASSENKAKFGGYAGRPLPAHDWGDHGVGHFFFMGANVLEVLRSVSEVCHD